MNWGACIAGLAGLVAAAIAGLLIIPDESKSEVALRDEEGGE